MLLSECYLVTGGAGFIGSHLCDALAKRDTEVRVLDNLSSGRMSNLSAVKDRVQFIKGDICDMQCVVEAIRGVSVVFHQAALSSVPRSVKEPEPTNRTNVGGTLNILMAAKEFGVRRVVYASSSSAYGETPALPKQEAMSPVPKSPYAVSKLAAEHYCRAFCATYGLETVCLRYFNVFGPRQDPFSQYSAVIPKFIASYLSASVPVIFGDGEQTRGFTFVDDVVQANLLAAEVDGIGGRMFNVAGNERMSVNEMDRILRRLLDVSPDTPSRFADERQGDIRHSFADISAAQTQLGYSPAVDIEDGLRRTVDWFQDQVAE
ncbi:SDR family oxidoreductase [Candidatus Bipolaricaulota bacterium]